MNPTDQQTDVLARQLTAPLIASFNKKKLRFNSRNRDAWKRMNRPHKLAQIESGSAKLMRFIG